jgi:hypothetical protein
MAENGRVVVGCSSGADGPDQVIVAYLTAGAALDRGKDVVLWLTSEGVRLAINGYVDPLRTNSDSAGRLLACSGIRSESESAWPRSCESLPHRC